LHGMTEAAEQRRIIVTGASGFVGRNVIRDATHEDGITTLPVVRSKAKAQECAFSRWIHFEDLASGVSAAEFAGVPIIHLVGSARDQDRSPMWDANVRTTECVVRAARLMGASRIVLLSGYGIDLESSDAYFRARATAEALIRESSVPFTIIRSSYVLGPGDELTPYLIDGLRGGRLELPGDGRCRIQPIYINDMSRILIRSALVKSTESVQDTVLGRAISLRDYVNLIAGRMGAQATIEEVPLTLFMRRAVMNRDPDFTLTELAILVSELLSAASDSYVGVKIRAIEETLHEWIPSGTGKGAATV